MDTRQIQICRIKFLTVNTFLGKFYPKFYPSCQFKLKFCTQTNWDMKNSRVTFLFPVFDLLLQVLSRKLNLVFWWYLINLPTVYSHRLQASGFSSYCMRTEMKKTDRYKYLVKLPCEHGPSEESVLLERHRLVR